MKHFFAFLCLTLLLGACNNKSLSGTYENAEPAIFQTIEFSGKNTCTLDSSISTSYVRDGDVIRIKTDKGYDLLLTIKNADTLIGKGWTEGMYVKKN